MSENDERKTILGRDSTITVSLGIVLAGVVAWATSVFFIAQAAGKKTEDNHASIEQLKTNVRISQKETGEKINALNVRVTEVQGDVKLILRSIENIEENMKRKARNE